MLEVNVTRYPYSFIGDSKGGASMAGAEAGEAVTQTWHDALLGYMGGDPRARDAAEASMRRLGAAAGIAFDYDVPAQWQPVDSQRLLLWAGRFGRQEPFMSALNRRHFQQRESASLRATLLAAAAEVGLDAAAAGAFLDTDELRDVVWEWYGRTIREKGIHSIPLFVFNLPTIDAVGPPFRAPGRARPYVVNGSMDAAYFLGLFEGAARDVAAGRRLAAADGGWDAGARGAPRDGGGACAR